MKRYERTMEAKRRRVENNDRMSVASSLLSLSEDGNDTRYCEPHTGLFSQTQLSMADIDELEECVAT